MDAPSLENLHLIVNNSTLYEENYPIFDFIDPEIINDAQLFKNIACLDIMKINKCSRWSEEVKSERTRTEMVLRGLLERRRSVGTKSLRLVDTGVVYRKGGDLYLNFTARLHEDR